MALPRALREQSGLEPNVISYSVPIAGCAELPRQWQHATGLVLRGDLEACGLEPTPITFGALLSATKLSEQWAPSLQVLQHMRRAGVRSNCLVLTASAGSCEAGQQWRAVLGLLQGAGLTSLQLDAIAFSSALSALQKAASWASALALLATIRRIGLAVRLAAGNSALSACEKGHQWDLAFCLLSSLQPLHLEPDHISHSVVISACEKGGLWRLAVQVVALGHVAGSPSTEPLPAAGAAGGRSCRCRLVADRSRCLPRWWALAPGARDPQRRTSTRGVAGSAELLGRGCRAAGNGMRRPDGGCTRIAGGVAAAGHGAA